MAAAAGAPAEYRACRPGGEAVRENRKNQFRRQPEPHTNLSSCLERSDGHKKVHSGREGEAHPAPQATLLCEGCSRHFGPWGRLGTNMLR